MAAVGGLRSVCVCQPAGAASTSLLGPRGSLDLPPEAVVAAAVGVAGSECGCLLRSPTALLTSLVVVPRPLPAMPRSCLSALFSPTLTGLGRCSHCSSEEAGPMKPTRRYVPSAMSISGVHALPMWSDPFAELGIACLAPALRRVILSSCSSCGTRSQAAAPRTSSMAAAISWAIAEATDIFSFATRCWSSILVPRRDAASTIRRRTVTATAWTASMTKEKTETRR